MMKKILNFFINDVEREQWKSNLFIFRVEVRSDQRSFARFGGRRAENGVGKNFLLKIICDLKRIAIPRSLLSICTSKSSSIKHLVNLLRISFILFIILTPVTHAEFTGTINIDPPNPSTYQAVTATLQSFSFNVDNSLITWYLDNKLIVSEIGKKQISLTTKGIGQTTTIKVQAKMADGNVFEASMTLAPQSVDLSWEATEGYVPPFYEGKAMPGESSQIKVVAVPSFSSSGKPIAPENLSYEWFVDDGKLEDQSGRGKNVAFLNLDYLSNDNVIRVDVTSDDGSTAENTVTISPYKLDPIFYFNDPILGPDFSKAIEDRFETTKEFSLALVPYGLSSSNNIKDYSSFSWSLDGLPIDTPADNVLSLRPTDNSYGSKSLSVNIENTKRMLQKGVASLQIVFDTRN